MLDFPPGAVAEEVYISITPVSEYPEPERVVGGTVYEVAPVDLTLAGPVELTIFDVSGRRVRTLVRETQEPGAHEVVWDGRNDGGRQAAAGVYFYRLSAGRSSRVRKMVIIR